MSKDLDEALVRKLAGLLEETGLGEIEYATGDLRIRIAKPTVNATYAAPMPTAAPVAAAPAAPAAAPAEDGEVVPSPMVGTAYIAPEPGAAAFAPVGSTVRKGQTIMIVEAMKTMNPIPAPRDGKIKSVHVENGQPVEFGQPLLVLE
ncbi:acetyl-CoA carboxylase biotin carboxyl carrier protein [Thalassobaculum litoreum]|uniref:Biotin carboxyl carrier protein of acetyl-CoA carboxylase n=1 Tax=Thalassobaculum litoreum DSM 18839 TaxID=1123362 RepID=A0A8G2F050_9PROT|nr:acetyl-CoA carboxylase biotin carboxyl carrier protein [Thalassobaculum litoreum]SDG50617.1 acetyl-CoA carboxylase biotin carboxyl carrier protein [Thalassobaculum litoreum DSM 18839]